MTENRNRSLHSELAESQIRNGPTRTLTTASRAWLTAGDIMSQDVATVSPGDSVLSAAKIMATRNISCLIISEGGNLRGIITETDVLRKALADGNDSLGMKVEQIMSSPVRNVSPGLSVMKTGKIMETETIRRLVVAEEGQSVGIITQTDIVRVLVSYTLSKEVSEIMTSDVATIPSLASVKEAAELMASRNISCLVVVDKETVAGIFTERDLLQRVVAERLRPAQTGIKDVMSSPAVTVPSDYSVSSASKLLEKTGIRRLVVADGNVLRGVVTQTDILKAVKRRLQEDEENYLGLLSECTNCIYTLDLDFRATYVNPAFMKLLEVSDPDELINQPFLPERFWDDPRERSQLLGNLAKANVEVKELTLRTSKGKKLFVTLFSTCVKNIRGEISGSQGVLYDVTARKELETRVQRRTAELSRANEVLEAEIAERERAERTLATVNAELESNIQQLSRSNKELQEFAYIAAHDLKTPLRGIGTLADWLATDYADKFDEEGSKHVELLTVRARRMSAMIDSILQYSSLQRHDQKKEQVDLSTVLSEVIAGIEPPANIRITVEDELPVLSCDKTHILQVLQNLLGNAVKYMDKPEGVIRVGCVEQDGFWKLSVADNGPGIDKRHFEKIFKIFQTLSSRDGVEGTGIGLSIVKKIAGLNGGGAWIESEVGKGSTFFFTLPKQARI